MVVAVDDIPVPPNDFLAAARAINFASSDGSGAWEAQTGAGALQQQGLDGDGDDDDDGVDDSEGKKGAAGNGAEPGASATVTLTLWRNSGAVAPLAEGWVPHVVVLDGKASNSSAQEKATTSASSVTSSGGLLGGLESAASSAAAVAAATGAGGLAAGGMGSLSSSKLGAKAEALQGVSPRRYLVLTHSGLLKMHASPPAVSSAAASAASNSGTSSSGALSAEPANKLHLKNVHSLQKVVDDATGRWQLLFWLKDKDGGNNSGKSVIAAFNGEDEMLLWLDVLSTLKVPQPSPSPLATTAADAEEEGAAAGAEEEGGGMRVLAAVPVVAEVMRVRSRGGARRLPRVDSGANARSGTAAGMRTTQSLLGAISSSGGLGGGLGGGGSAAAGAAQAEAEARRAAAQAAATAQAFVADPEAALRDIFGESPTSASETRSGGSAGGGGDAAKRGSVSGGEDASSLLSLGGSFFADSPSPSTEGEGAPPGGGRRVGRVSGLGRRPSARF